MRTLSLILLGLISLGVALAQEGTGVPTAVNGYFEESQAEAGRAAYQQHCSSCHGESLLGGTFGGPPIAGSYFAQRWQGRSVGELHEYITQMMPLGQGGTLTGEAYRTITAYLLSMNGFIAGMEPIGADTGTLDLIINFPPESSSE